MIEKYEYMIIGAWLGIVTLEWIKLFFEKLSRKVPQPEVNITYVRKRSSKRKRGRGYRAYPQ